MEWIRGGLVLAALVSVLALPRHAGADSRRDGVEHIFGATNIHAVTGHGRMSVGVSAQGELTVLTWPNPSYADQILYATSNAVDARSRPRMGAYEGAGVFFGLLVEPTTGAPEVVWLRDPAEFETSQSYGPDDGANVHTLHVSDRLGLEVTVVDAVRPPVDGDPTDVLVRQVTVERLADSTVQDAWLLSYANLSPVPPNSRVPKLPVVDWAFDGRNDFAAVWDDTAQAVIHFHPDDERVFTNEGDLLSPPDVDFGPVGDLLQSASPDPGEVQTLAGNLDSEYSQGAYMALTTAPAPDQHHIGFDETPMCDFADEFVQNVAALPETFPDLSLPIPVEVAELLLCDREALDYRSRDGWVYDADDAYVDAQDGELTGGDLAAGEVNEVLRTPLTFTDVGGRDLATADLLLSAGPTADQVRQAVSDVQDPGPGETVVQAAEDALATWLSDKRIPAEAPEDVTRVARRSLINVRVGTVAENGTIVASISRQPPYGLDWPRDGAFFNVMLDVSGQPQVVAERATLYADWQRKTPEPPNALLMETAPPLPDGRPGSVFPEGGWEMNYYSDGMIGGVFRFEIDNAGFAIWTMVAHAGWADDPIAYLEDHWDAIRLGTDFLAEWRDPETGLQAPAQEDDNPGFVQTLHGAVTTFGALEMASRGARLIGEDADAERWEQRAGELRDAMIELLWHEGEQRFVKHPGMFEDAGSPTGPTAWSIWPMTLLPFDDPRIEAQVRHDHEAILPRVNLETDGGAYFMKNTVSNNVAQLGLSDDALADLVPAFEDVLATLATHATPGSDHFGEVMVVVEEDGMRRADQRTANPHLWEGALFYLTAMALEDPAALTRYDEVLPPSQVPAAPPASGGDGGCGCRVTGAGPAGAPAGLALLIGLVAALVYRRRR
ncbi:MAG: MYXO-CTERM sorting domain-containing protein [Myxococcota bacterium]